MDSCRSKKISAWTTWLISAALAFAAGSAAAQTCPTPGGARICGNGVVEEHFIFVGKVVEAPPGIRLHAQAEHADVDAQRLGAIGHLESVADGENPVALFRAVRTCQIEVLRRLGLDFQ